MACWMRSRKTWACWSSAGRQGGDGPSPDMFWASSSLMASSVVASSFSSLAMSQVWSPAAELGVTHVSNWMMFGGIEHEKIMESIRLMGEEVIPALKDVHPPEGLAEELAQSPPASTEELRAARFGPAPSDVTTT